LVNLLDLCRVAGAAPPTDKIRVIIIMNVLRLLPVILSLLLLAAHFYRAGIVPLAGLCLVLPALLFVRQRWVPWVMQGALVLGSLEWLLSLYRFASVRIALEQPWTRLAIILGAVALLTALSALVFRSRAVKQRYSPSTDYIA
jgi:hypothetical protein